MCWVVSVVYSHQRSEAEWTLKQAQCASTQDLMGLTDTGSLLPSVLDDGHESQLLSLHVCFLSVFTSLY